MGRITTWDTILGEIYNIYLYVKPDDLNLKIGNTCFKQQGEFWATLGNLVRVTFF